MGFRLIERTALATGFDCVTLGPLTTNGSACGSIAYGVYQIGEV